MTRWIQDTRRTSRTLVLMMAALIVLATVGVGCGDGMLGWGSTDQSGEVEQAQVVAGRYLPPHWVARAGRAQAGNITYDNADRCIGNGKAILPGSQALAKFLLHNFPGPSRYDKWVVCRPVRGGHSLSMHATGRAIDLYIPTIGDQADNSKGDPVANYLIVNATKLGVQYFIWDHSQFNTERGVVEDYCKGNCWDNGGSKSQHHDHLHIELTKQAANHLKQSDMPAVGRFLNGGAGSSASAPHAPAQLGPANGDSVWTNSATLKAKDVAGAYAYSFDIQVYQGSSWQHYYTYKTNGASSKTFWPANKAAYRWRVNVTTAGGTSDYSGWSTFWFGIASGSGSASSGSSTGSATGNTGGSATDNGGGSSTGSTTSNTGSSTGGGSSTTTGSGSSTTTPSSNAPIGAWPTASQRVNGDSVTLQVDAVSGANKYEFEIQVYENNQWVDYYTYSTDASAKEFWPYYSDSAYRWRARAHAASGWTDQTTWNVFLYGNASDPTGAAGAPTSNAPTGLSPADGAHIYTSDVTVSCDAVSGADGYQFDVQYYDGSTWRDYYSYDTTTSSKHLWPYLSDTPYRVRVRASIASGWTDYSAWNVFLFGNATAP